MALIFLLVMAAVATILAFAVPQRGLLVAVFLLPWSGLDVDVGVRLTPYLIFSAIFFFAGIVRLFSTDPRIQVFRSLGSVGFIAIYSMLWSIAQIPFLPEANVAGGVMRTPEVRALTQIIVFFITLSPLFVIPLFVGRLADIFSLGRMYLISMVVLAIVGWGQLLLWKIIGSDPFPVGIFGEFLGGASSIRSGVFDFNGMSIYRMSSFGGEPKDLGVSLAVALLLLQAFPHWFRSERISGLLWLFLLVSLVFTFSTTALLGWMGASLLQLISRSFVAYRDFERASPHRQGILIGALAVFMLTVSVMEMWGVVNMIDIIEHRTVGRLEAREDGVLEDFNVAVLEFLSERPGVALTGVGLGNIHLYADPYLPAYATYAGGTAFVAKSGALRWVSEIGLVSFVVFLCWVSITVSSSASVLRRLGATSGAVVAIIKISVSVTGLWMVAGQVTPHLVSVLGGILSARLIAQRWAILQSRTEY